MYKDRLRPALVYYENLTKDKELSSETAQEEMKRLAVQIGFFQHERLIHLIVTVLFGLVTVITVLAYLFTLHAALLALGAMFVCLLFPYIIHYYHLENGVQQLYIFYNHLEVVANPGFKKLY